MPSYYTPTKNMTDAYHTDDTHEWFGKAAKGTSANEAAWQIFKMEYQGSDWIIKWPVDSSTGLASDAPKFVWDDVESYDYSILGCKLSDVASLSESPSESPSASPSA